jgi:hypothetical protein
VQRQFGCRSTWWFGLRSGCVGRGPPVAEQPLRDGCEGNSNAASGDVELQCRARSLAAGDETKSLFLLVRTRTGPLRSQFVLTIAVHGSMSPTPRWIAEVVGRCEQPNGRSVKDAENFSWSGMSSAVRRLTQGALAPSPHNR